MEVRTLELNLISAQGLKKASAFGRNTCYGVVYIYPSEKMATGVDRNGGENPSWNEKLTLSCDDKLLRQGRSVITVEIYSFGSFSNKIVGTAKISLVDVGKQQGEEPQFMAYEVRRPSGKVKGVLNLSVKVGEKRTVEQNNHYLHAVWASSPADRKHKPQQDVLAMTGYSQTYPPVQGSPPPTWSSLGRTAPPYPSPTTSYDSAVANNGVSVHPLPKPSSESTGDEASTVSSVHPPPKPPGDSSDTSSSDARKYEEPVLAYPASGVPAAYPPSQYGQQYGPQYYGPQYAPGPQEYYYPAAQPPHGYQQQYQNSRPSKYHGSSGSSGAGLGLLGGLLGGLLIGDVIGDIF